MLFGEELGVKREDGNSLLRDKFKKRCVERAIKAREAKVHKGRKWESSSEPDIDGDVGMDEDDDEMEDADEALNDEVCCSMHVAVVHSH